MGVIAEGFDLLDEEIKNNLSIILLDTMGVYWSMKHPNNAIKRSELEEYNLSPKAFLYKYLHLKNIFIHIKKRYSYRLSFYIRT